MIDRTLLLRMARYHAWATEQLLNSHLCALSDEMWRRPVGLFFGSIESTVNHLLLADRIWWGRCVDKPLPLRRLDEPMAADRDGLVSGLLNSVQGWPGLIESLSDDTLAGDLRYQRVNGQDCTLPWSGVLQHIFNHGTHHRGQITAALTAMGCPCPALDLVYFLLQPTP